MGIFRQITCAHLEAIFYEENEKVIHIPSKGKSENRKIRIVYCPGCGLTMQASRADENDKKE